MNWKWSAGIACFLLSVHPLLGQYSPEGIDFPDNYSDELQQDDYDIGPDTMDIFYFYPGNPGEEYSFSDSLLGNFFQQYDPIRLRDLDYMNLGNLGSAARPVVYEPLYRRGFDVGLHQFDIYKTSTSELPFYRIDRAYTNLTYYQRGEQADSYIKGKFSRNFAGGLNFSIDYHRIHQLGTRDQFPNQNTRNTALATGLWYHGKGGRYDGFLSLAWNTIEQQDNGGILEEPMEEEGFGSPSSAVVFLQEAQTRHREQGIAYTHYYTFGKPEEPARAVPRRRPPGIQADSTAFRPSVPDSLARTDSLARPVSRDSLFQVPRAPATPAVQPNRRRFTLAHEIAFRNARYKYYDADLDNDLAIDYYGDFLVDTRGLRFFLHHRQLENTFRLRTTKPRPSTGGEAQRQRDLLEVGINHRINWLDLENGDSTVSNLFLLGRIHFQPGERLNIETYGHFGLWDHAGDYRVYGELTLGLGKIGSLSVSANNQLYEPNLMQQRLTVSERTIYGNDFGKTLETNIKATYRLPQWSFELTGAYHLLNNYVYFDTLAMPRQTGVPVSVAQLIVKKDFRVGKFHLDNVLALQTSSEPFLRVPDIFYKGSLYYQGKWFGVLNVQLGFDGRMNSGYSGYYYFPLNGQFTLFDDADIPFYPSVDVFLAMRVTRFRAFFKWENATNFVINDRLYYLNALYPLQTGSGFRVGINWRFVD